MAFFCEALAFSLALQPDLIPGRSNPMSYPTPALLFDAVVKSRNEGDLATYLSCYEENATIVIQPGTVAAGQEGLRGFFAFFTSLKPTFTVVRREFIEGDNVTLHMSAWTLKGTDPAGNPIDWSGRTCDVLRKQADGTWLVSLDNPYGTALLDPAA
jgi:ketosteroid isomerase-like protein